MNKKALLVEKRIPLFHCEEVVKSQGYIICERVYNEKRKACCMKHLIM